MNYSYPYYSRARIDALLQRCGGAVRKRWGQNFLIDPNYCRRIADLILNETSGDLIEIGPGTGSLTWQLLEAGRRVTAVEIDPLLANALQEELGERFPLLKVVEQDVRNFLRERQSIPAICGNLPYYITAEILTAVVRLSGIRTAVFLIQSEPAMRIVAKKAESSLTVFLQNFGEWKITHKVPANAFYPRPRVESSLLLFQTHAGGPRCDGELLERVLRMSYGGRRKKIENAWKKSAAGPLSVEQLLAAARDTGLNTDRRPDDLDAADYYHLVLRLASLP